MNFTLSRRSFLGTSFAIPALAYAPILRAAQSDLSELSDMTVSAQPITSAERVERIARAQKLMEENDIAAVVIEPGASLTYFTGIEWGRSERVTGAVLPREGEPLVVTPFFEEPSVHETLDVPAELRVWQEDESPLTLIADWLRERQLASGMLGIEETARYFVADGLAARLPQMRTVSADPVVRTLRMHKSASEIALMQMATDVTMAAYRWIWPRVEAGMTGPQISALMNAATRALGGTPQFSLALVGEASAYPHGSRKVHKVADGEVLLMDCGCAVHGYESDVSRTFSYGSIRSDVARVWDTVARGQRIVFEAAQIGTPAGRVDDAVRAFYESEGYGPDYALPGLSHRTGHGIGMDGHEPINLVRGEETPLAAGMCFSDEPGIYLPGRFGVRLEDCFHMTENGPSWFSEPAASIENPI